MQRGELAQHAVAGHAQSRLQAAGGIVHAGMDDLGIARRDAAADGVAGLQHHHLAPRERERAGGGQPYDARADDHAVQPFVPG